MIAPKKDSSPLHPVWWFWLPLGFALGLAVVEQFLPHETRAGFYRESGMVENAQAVVAFIAAGFGAACLKYCRGNKWLLAWVLIGTLTSLYIGLEEISYGQHFFQWQTPEEWQAINRQQETNLHNTTSWLNEKPKLLLFIGVLAGGIVIPLLRRKKPGLLPEKFSLIYPEDPTFWSAVLALYGYVVKVLHKQEILMISARPAEINELYLYYFVMIYFVLLRMKLKAKA